MVRLKQRREHAVNQTLIDFEQYTRLGPTYAAELLGVSYSIYGQVRRGSRHLQLYTERHIEALQRLPHDTLQQLIQEHVRDGWQKD